MNILLFMILSIVCLIAIILWGNWYMKFVYRVMVQQKKDDIDDIMASYSIPLNWSKGYLRYKKLFTDNELYQDMLLKNYNRKKLIKLKKLMRFLKMTRVIENEEVRKIQMSNLEGLYKQLYDAKKSE